LADDRLFRILCTAVRSACSRIESQLKEQLNTANRANDVRLLKLALVMAILAFAAALVYGKISL